MERHQWEVIIVKPTSTFVSFLTAQFPDIDLPDLHTLQADNTAYAMHKQVTEEAMLDEIERNYLLMFKHEIGRWLGEGLAEEVSGSFFDFLCCFKFELHSQIILMEPSIDDAHQVLCIKPRSVLLKWMESPIHEDEDDDDVVSILERVNLSNLTENTTVVMKNFNKPSDVSPFIKHYYQPLFNAEMSRMCDKADQWPTVDTVQAFSHYFAVEVHSTLVHLH